jgi:hypothetical protein
MNKNIKKGSVMFGIIIGVLIGFASTYPLAIFLSNAGIIGSEDMGMWAIVLVVYPIIAAIVCGLILGFIFGRFSKDK